MNKTQKHKLKKKKWKEFDIMMNEDSELNPLECIYEKHNSTGQCSLCNSGQYRASPSLSCKDCLAGSADTDSNPIKIL